MRMHLPRYEVCLLDPERLFLFLFSLLITTLHSVRQVTEIWIPEDLDFGFATGLASLETKWVMYTNTKRLFV
jgi:hypothetical protein